MNEWNLNARDWDGQFDDFVDGTGTVICAFEYIEPDDWESGPGDVDLVVWDETGVHDLTYDISMAEYKRLLKEARRLFFEEINARDY